MKQELKKSDTRQKKKVTNEKQPRCENPGCGLAGTDQCSRCNHTNYCGRACQKEHWQTHKKVCGAVAKGRVPVAFRMFRQLAGQILRSCFLRSMVMGIYPELVPEMIERLGRRELEMLAWSHNRDALVRMQGSASYEVIKVMQTTWKECHERWIRWVAGPLYMHIMAFLV